LEGFEEYIAQKDAFVPSGPEHSEGLYRGMNGLMQRKI
jgi:hypothetical protein